MNLSSRVDPIVEKLDTEQSKLKSALSRLPVRSKSKPLNTPLLVLRELTRSADKIRRLHN